jgi:hypothetical protein
MEHKGINQIQELGHRWTVLATPTGLGPGCFDKNGCLQLRHFCDERLGAMELAGLTPLATWGVNSAIQDTGSKQDPPSLTSGTLKRMQLSSRK